MKRKNFLLSISLVLILALGLGMLYACNGSPKSVNATISKDNMGVEIADTMYGLFLEDISYAGDGGLISELVNNGSFEYEANPTAYWNIDGSAEVKNIYGLNEANPSYLHLVVDGTAQLENLGYIEYYDNLTENYNKDKMNTADMGFHKDVEYDLSFYVRIADFEGTISAGLSSPSNSEKIALTLPQQKDEWVKVSCVLTSKATEDGSLVFIAQGKGELDVDFVSLVPHDTFGYGSDEWKYVTLRQDLYDALDALSPAFIRFPGGCLAEGDTFEHLFDWKKTIGPLEEREQYHNIWRDEENGKYYNNTFALGYHEYFQLCEDLGAKALPILNVGMICQFEADYRQNAKAYAQGKMSKDEWEKYLDTFAIRPGTAEFDAYIQDIMDLIDYANGTDISNEWVQKRIQNGHPEPFNIEYIGLGNENWGEVYWRNFDALYKAVKEAHPELTIISSASFQFGGEYFDDCWEHIRANYSDTLVDEHYYTSQNKLFKNNDRYDSYDRNSAKVFVGEYAASPWGIGKYWSENNLWSAVEEASYLTALERNGDVVKMASYAPTFAKINAQCWDINMIWFDSQNIVLTPNYFNQMLFANNTGSRYIDTGITAKGIYSSASVDEETQTLYVKLVNVNASAMDVSLSFDGFGKLNASSMQYMSGERASYNGPNMTTIVPKQVNCNIDGSNVTTRIDGQSINIIRVYYGDNDGSEAYNLPALPENMQNEITQFNTFVMTPEIGFVVGIIGIALLLTVVFIVIAIINKKLIYKKAGLKRK
ncbi:MAG: hypothetical protein K2L52_04345 [Clostridia bacterium]|nr:hypothetical protein [Clostridia bacterium]